MRPTASGPSSMARSVPLLILNSPAAVAAAVVSAATYAAVPDSALRQRKKSANEHQAKLGAAITRTAHTATSANIHVIPGLPRPASTATAAYNREAAAARPRIRRLSAGL